MKVQVHDAVGHFDAAETRAAECKQAVHPRGTGNRGVPALEGGEGFGEGVDCICLAIALVVTTDDAVETPRWALRAGAMGERVHAGALE